jgi:hypothetical protein
VEIEAFFQAVVDETPRGLAASVADPALDRVRRLVEEAELELLAVAEQRMHQGVETEQRIMCAGATRVEDRGMAPAAEIARVPGPVTGLLAAVAQEQRAGVRHQLQLVLRVGRIADLRRRILVHICSRYLFLRNDWFATWQRRILVHICSRYLFLRND